MNHKKLYKPIIYGFASISLLATNLWAQETNSKATVVLSKPKLSKPFSELARPLPELSAARKNKLRLSGDKVPGEGQDRIIPNKQHPYPNLSKDKKSTPDPVLQSSMSNPLASNALQQRNTSTMGIEFDALGNVTGATPPDTNADVGPNHIVQTVNVALAIYDKEGNELLGATPINALWDGFGGLCETNNNGDPIVLYDSQADRWLISQFAFNSSNTDNRECIAISTTGDPTGSYYLYDFFYSDTLFNDYPHFGVWTDAYYMGVNQFLGNSFAGSGIVAYERDQMLVGQPAQQVIIDLGVDFPFAFTPMPADIDGIFLPPEDLPGIFVTADNDDELNVWHFNVDWNDTDNASVTLVESLAVSPYAGAVCGFSRNCIEQPNNQNLDAIPQRMMFRLAYRNLDGQSKLVANHTVVGSATDNNIAGVRWYEIDLDNAGNPTLANNGTFNLADGNSRWMGSAAMDAVGNIGVAYSVSGPNLAPSIRYSGRLANDPPNMLTLDEQELRAGEGSQSGANRWGDYSSLSVDPTDDCTMWYTTEYYRQENEGTTGWQTHISSFRFDNCQAGPRGELTGTVTDPDGEAVSNALVTIGAISVTTRDDGTYSVTLPVGTDFSATAFRYGFQASAATTFAIEDEATTTLDISLAAATPITVSGTITDGSGLGRPLLADIVVRAPGTTLSTASDPTTGSYSIDLFEGTLVQVQTTASLGGYVNSTIDLIPEQNPLQNIALEILGSCTAVGYGFPTPALFEDFEAGVPPTDWTIVNTGLTSETWEAGSTSVRGNLLGTGESVTIDSDAGGSAAITAGILTSPVIPISGIEDPVLTFSSLFRTFGNTDDYRVEVSVNGGNWQTALIMVPTNTNESLSVDLSSFAAQGDEIQIRWNYNAVFEFYAYIDNVRVGNATCGLRDGNVIAGTVSDANTNLALNGALVTSGQDEATTFNANTSTPGYYEIFIEQATESVSFSLLDYEVLTADRATVTNDANISLDAPLLDIEDSSPTFNVTQGRSSLSTIPLSNTGNVGTEFRTLLTIAPPQPNTNIASNAIKHSSSRHFGPKNLNDIDTRKRRHSFELLANQVNATVAELVEFYPLTGQQAVYGIGYNQDNGNTWISTASVLGAPSVAEQYNQDRQLTDVDVDLTSITTAFAADMTYNNRSGNFWQVDVGGNNCINEWDPASAQVTGRVICPDFGTSQRGLVYDPLTDTFFSGSFNDSIIHQFTTSGTILRSVNVGLAISGLAYNPVEQLLYVMINDVAAEIDVAVLDASSADFSRVDELDFPDADYTGDDGVLEPAFVDNEQSGLTLDCDGTLWTVSRSNIVAIGINSGNTNVCDWRSVEFVSLESDTTQNIDAQSTSDIQLNFSTEGLEPGSYTAQLAISANTPYEEPTRLVTFNVTEPEFGTLGLSATSTSVANGNTVTLSVNRTDGADFAVSVDYTTENATALAGTHYQATSGTLSWPDGDTDPRTITVSTLDIDLDTNLTFGVTLSNAQGGADTGSTSSIIVIQADPPSSGGSTGMLILAILAVGTGFRRRLN